MSLTFPSPERTKKYINFFGNCQKNCLHTYDILLKAGKVLMYFFKKGFKQILLCRNKSTDCFPLYLPIYSPSHTFSLCLRSNSVPMYHGPYLNRASILIFTTQHEQDKLHLNFPQSNAENAVCFILWTHLWKNQLWVFADLLCSSSSVYWALIIQKNI